MIATTLSTQTQLICNKGCNTANTLYDTLSRVPHKALCYEQIHNLTGILLFLYYFFFFLCFQLRPFVTS